MQVSETEAKPRAFIGRHKTSQKERVSVIKRGTQASWESLSSFWSEFLSVWLFLSKQFWFVVFLTSEGVGCWGSPVSSLLDKSLWPEACHAV